MQKAVVSDQKQQQFKAENVDLGTTKTPKVFNNTDLETIDVNKKNKTLEMTPDVESDKGHPEKNVFSIAIALSILAFILVVIMVLLSVRKLR